MFEPVPQRDSLEEGLNETSVFQDRTPESWEGRQESAAASMPCLGIPSGTAGGGAMLRIGCRAGGIALV